MSDLIVVLNGLLTGTVIHDAGWPRFTYSDEYADDIDATPLSLSMPVASGRTYDPRITAPWLMNLLPDDADVRADLAREFGAPHGSATALLERIGRDCAGAVQLAAPEDIDDVLTRTGSLQEVTDVQIVERMRALQSAPQRWTRPGERWSLAGAQPKFTAVRTDAGGWAYVHGNATSTHIIKPGIARYPGSAFNEYLCLRALSAVGISSVVPELIEFDGVAAIAVERYDRLRRADGCVIRLHQEDMCQALGVRPQNKYPSNGGPSATKIAELLARDAAPGDVDRFADAVIAQYLLGAPDAHAKNYSIILNGVDATLAPLYDVASSLPYDPDPDSALSRVAMPIGGRSRFGEVTLHHVAEFAHTVGADPDRLVARTREMAAALPDVLSETSPAVIDPTLTSLRTRLVDTVAAHCTTIDTTDTRGNVKRSSA
jgi:serine/threonine-protein kinase HipA